MCYSMFTKEGLDYMSPTPVTLARTMANALNRLYGTHIVINTTQFFGGEGKLVRMYVIKDAYFLGSKKNYSDKELFKTASGVYTCLFMRDMLFAFQGKPPAEITNEGYLNVFAKKNGQASIDYMLEKYLGGKEE